MHPTYNNCGLAEVKRNKRTGDDKVAITKKKFWNFVRIFFLIIPIIDNNPLYWINEPNISDPRLSPSKLIISPLPPVTDSNHKWSAG